MIDFCNQDEKRESFVTNWLQVAQPADEIDALQPTLKQVGDVADHDAIRIFMHACWHDKRCDFFKRAALQMPQQFDRIHADGDERTPL